MRPKFKLWIHTCHPRTNFAFNRRQKVQYNLLALKSPIYYFKSIISTIDILRIFFAGSRTANNTETATTAIIMAS